MKDILVGLKKFSGDTVSVFQYFQMLRFGSNLLLSIFLVKSTLSLTEIGYYETLIFISGLLSMFWVMGITQSFNAYYPSLEGVLKDKLIKTTFRILLSFGLIMGCLLFLSKNLIAKVLTDFDGVPHIELLVVFLIFSVPTVLVENIFLVKDKATALRQYGHWSYGIYLLIIAGILHFAPSLQNIMYGLIIWSGLKFLFLLTLLYSLKKTSSHTPLLKPFLILSIPLILNGLLSVSMDYVDNLLVLYYFEPDFFPIFKYGARELPFALLLLSALSNAMVPRLVRNGLLSDEIKVRTSKLMHLLFPPAILLMFISPYLFPLVYDEAFVESAYIFNTYLLILISRVLLPHTYNYALRQNKIILLAGIIEIVLNIILSIWWVQIFGIYGLAMATVIAYFVHKCLLIFYNHRYNQIAISRYIDMKWYSYYSILMVIGFILSFILKI